MTETEKSNLVEEGVPGVDLGPGRKNLTSTEKFELELQKHEKKATKAMLPFARQVVREDFKNLIKLQTDEQLREYGRIEFPEKLTPPKIDWSKYSNLKNFKLIETKEVYDKWLTQINPGLRVQSQTKVYKFKGYGNTYSVMEDGPSSIARAQKLVAESRK